MLRLDFCPQLDPRPLWSQLILSIGPVQILANYDTSQLKRPRSWRGKEFAQIRSYARRLVSLKAESRCDWPPSVGEMTRFYS